MNKLNPKKLLNSKWTAIPAINKEKHFIIVCLKIRMEALMCLTLVQSIGGWSKEV